MNWIQRLLCPDSGKIAQLEKALAEKEDKIKWLEEQIKKGATTSDFVFTGEIRTISNPDLLAKLKVAFPDAEFRLNDGEYKYTTLAEVQRWASFDPTNELKYRADELDCDKFALTDMADFKKENNYQLGNAVFGICIGNSPVGYHAWNIAYVEEGLYFLEPQNDSIWKWDSNTEYKPDFIYI